MNKLRNILKYLNDKNIYFVNDIKFTHLTSYLRLFSDNKNTKKTIMNQKSILKMFLGYCYKHQIIKNNPAALLRNGRKLVKITRDYSMEEVSALLQTIEMSIEENVKNKNWPYYLKDIRNYVIVQTILEFGTRISETLDIELQGINEEQNYIQIKRAKRNNVDIIYGNTQYFKILKRLITHWKIKPGEFIFMSDPFNRRKYNSGAATASITKYLKKTFINNICIHQKGRSVHGLRRTAGEVARQTLDVGDSIVFLNHSNSENLGKYQNPSWTEKHCAVGKNPLLENIFDFNIIKTQCEIDEKLKSLTRVDFDVIYEYYMSGYISFDAFYRKIGVSPSYLSLLIKEHEIKLNKYSKKFRRMNLVMPDNFKEVYDEQKSGKITYKKAAQKLNVSETTYGRWCKKHKTNTEKENLK